MSNSKNTLSFSLGRKLVMGLTGLFLVMFLLVHCAINALIFLNDGGEAFNGGAEFMGTNPIIRTMEIVLFAGLIWHIIQGLSLVVANKKARPVQYAAYDGAASSKWYSRSMGLLGTLILMFLVVHLGDFWFESRIEHEISESHTMFDEMKEAFSNLWVVVLYVLAMISLSYHLMHGFQSAFQSLGWNHKRYTPLIKTIGMIYAIIIPVLFALMPLAMYLGIIQ